MNPSKLVGAVEIGTSSVKVLIGDIVNGRSLNIIGMGQCSSRGIKKGEILDFKAASNCVQAAIMGAEKTANVQIGKVYLSQTGGHLAGSMHSASVNVSGSDSVVRADDIQRVIREAKGKELPPGRVYIHHMQNGFLLDGEAVDKPLGMEGEKLEVSYWSVHGDEDKIRDHIHAINGIGLTVEDMIISSIASGIMVVEESEKSAGVLVVDMGCGATDWVYYKDKVVKSTGVVSIGGDHIINDLSLGLRVNRKNAERLFLHFGKAFLEKEDRGEKVWMVGDQMIGDRYLSKQGLVEIIQERVREIFEIIKKQLGADCSPAEIVGGAVLTGGLSRLSGIEVAAGKTLGLNARIGSNPNWVRDDLRTPEFSSTLGLLHYALTGQEQDPPETISKKGGLLTKVAKIFG